MKQKPNAAIGCLSLIIISLIVFFVIVISSLLTEDSPKHEEDSNKEKTTETAEDNNKSGIDTSIFENAQNIETHDNLKTNKHVTIFIDMSKDISSGLATQKVIKQTYSFLQQDDIKKARTITIGIRQGGKKIAQLTVNKEKFIPNPSDSMSKVIFDSSNIDYISEEVKKYGTAMEWW